MINLRSPLRLTLIVGVAALLGSVAWHFDWESALPKVSFSENSKPKSAVNEDKTPKIAPEFALKDASGRTVHLSDYKGKVVLLDFWATWCGPCNIEIPWFSEFEKKYQSRGFEVLGVSMDDDGWKSVNPFVARKNINYRILLGNDTTGDQYGGVEALPTTFVIDRNGRIASVHVGLSGKKEFEDAIEQLL